MAKDVEIAGSNDFGSLILETPPPKVAEPTWTAAQKVEITLVSSVGNPAAQQQTHNLIVEFYRESGDSNSQIAIAGKLLKAGENGAPALQMILEGHDFQTNALESLTFEERAMLLDIASQTEETRIRTLGEWVLGTDASEQNSAPPATPNEPSRTIAERPNPREDEKYRGSTDNSGADGGGAPKPAGLPLLALTLSEILGSRFLPTRDVISENLGEAMEEIINDPTSFKELLDADPDTQALIEVMASMENPDQAIPTLIGLLDQVEHQETLTQMLKACDKNEVVPELMKAQRDPAKREVAKDILREIPTGQAHGSEPINTEGIFGGGDIIPNTGVGVPSLGGSGNGGTSGGGGSQPDISIFNDASPEAIERVLDQSASPFTALNSLVQIGAPAIPPLFALGIQSRMRSTGGKS
jgi:hypothetical protein